MKKKGNISVAMGLMFSVMIMTGSAQATSISQDVTFATAGQNIWGEGSASQFNLDKFYGLSWNQSMRIGDIYRKWHGDYGAEARATTRGKIGVDVNASVSTGSVDVNYPVNITLDLPDPGTVKPGDTYTIYSSFVNLPSANMTIHPSNVDISMLMQDFNYTHVLEPKSVLQSA